jgi:hypothetical protein
MRVREQSARLELGQFRPHGGRGERKPVLDEALRADGLPRRDVLVHDEPQDLGLPGGEFDLGHLQEF